MVWASDTLHVLVVTIAAGLLIAAAVSDAKRYLIPNGLCLLLVVLFPLFVHTSIRDIPWEHHLMVGAVVLVIGIAMFSGNFAGAGDVKLLAATALWAGPQYIGVLLVVTGLAGGLLALVMVFVAWRRGRFGGDTALAHVPIPYGVAIATGGLASLLMLTRNILF